MQPLLPYCTYTFPDQILLPGLLALSFLSNGPTTDAIFPVLLSCFWVAVFVLSDCVQPCSQRVKHHVQQHTRMSPHRNDRDYISQECPRQRRPGQGQSGTVTTSATSRAFSSQQREPRFRSSWAKFPVRGPSRGNADNRALLWPPPMPIDDYDRDENRSF